jgi:hypothetical protein
LGGLLHGKAGGVQRFAASALLSAAALATGAGAAAQPPIGIRDEAAAVRVVVHVPGASLAPGTVEAVDAKPVDGRVVVAIERAPAAGARANAAGVSVRLGRNGGLTVRTQAKRFKYLGLSALPSRHDVVLVLWKRKPTAGAVVRRGARGCLTVDAWHTARGTVTASGREAGIFEHSFALRVRDASGDLVGDKPVTAARRRWHASVRARVTIKQIGMLEAYDPGASDSALGMCLAQVRAQLRP